MIAESGQLACVVCGAKVMVPFFTLESMPLFCNVLWESSEKAKNCQRGDIKLVCCPNCGLICNESFDPARLDYDVDYENSLHFSSRFQEYANYLANRLVNDYSLINKDIIEIGCGKGDFLLMLCQAGGNRGLGFDKSYVKRPEHTEVENIRFIQDFYSEQYADRPADLICCRHVLEHMDQPVAFLRQIRKIIGNRNNTMLFFEVPNGLHTFEKMAVWDIIYEHPIYFSPTALATTFELSGFTAQHIQPEFDNQFLSIVAGMAPSDGNIANVQANEVSRLIDLVRDFSGKFDRMRGKWSADLEQMRHDRKKAVIWGSGSKGITFLNVMDCADIVQLAVDINPRKQGKFIAGTGQRIVGPEELIEHSPDVIFIMNPLYKSEIRKMADSMGLLAEIMVV